MKLLLYRSVYLADTAEELGGWLQFVRRNDIGDHELPQWRLQIFHGVFLQFGWAYVESGKIALDLPLLTNCKEGAHAVNLQHPKFFERISDEPTRSFFTFDY